MYYHKNIILIIMQGLLMQLQNEKYDGLTDKIEWTEKKYIKTSIKSWKNRKSTSMKESCFKPEEIPNMDSFK